MGSPFTRYAPWKRARQEIAYGRCLARELIRIRPDVVVLSNTPLIALSLMTRACKKEGIATVLWQQDIVSAAIRIGARERLGAIGGLVGLAAEYAERASARSASRIVPICDEFLPTLSRWGVEAKSTVIPNWAPLPELPVRPRDNQWAQKHGLVGIPVALYSGTLGIKHDPSLLVALSEAMQGDVPGGQVVVVSEGLGRDWLAAQKRLRGLDNLILLDYQPNASFPDVIASAEVLIAILEPSAARYSVPSKVLSYLCAQRPVVAVMPRHNAAARAIHRSRGGVVVEPEIGPLPFTRAVVDLISDVPTRAEMGNRGRRYAEATFDIQSITDRFEAALGIA